MEVAAHGLVKILVVGACLDDEGHRDGVAEQEHLLLRIERGQDVAQGRGVAGAYERGGDVFLVVHAPGFLPVRKAVGWMAANKEGEVLVAQPVTMPDVYFLYGGKALGDHEITIADLSVGDFQPAVEVYTDRKGAISSEWLERARRYFLMVKGPLVPANEFVAATITWVGQKELEMPSVPT